MQQCFHRPNRRTNDRSKSSPASLPSAPDRARLRGPRPGLQVRCVQSCQGGARQQSVRQQKAGTTGHRTERSLIRVEGGGRWGAKQPISDLEQVLGRKGVSDRVVETDYGCE